VFRIPGLPAVPGLRTSCSVIALVAVATAATACGGGKHAASPAITLTAGLKLQQQGHLNEAAQLYQQVIAAQPSNLYAHYDLGVVDQDSGNLVGALAAYGAALTINPKYVPALYNDATIYTTTDPISAISLYRQITTLQPSAPTSYLNLGFLEIKNGAPKQGVRDLATAINQDSALFSRIPKNLQRLVDDVATSKRAASASPKATPSTTKTPHGKSPTTSPS
jgi:tetratricopeptide (TPR) repeat protein